MNASDSNSPFNDASYSRERLELETRVLAAALRQSLEIGDTEGSSLAHEQIFLLLKASQEMHIDEPINLPREVLINRGRSLPDIDWGSSEEPAPATSSEAAAPSGETAAHADNGQVESQAQNQVEIQTESHTESQTESQVDSQFDTIPPTGETPVDAQPEGGEAADQAEPTEALNAAKTANKSGTKSGASNNVMNGVSADLADLVEMAAAAADNNFAPPVAEGEQAQGLFETPAVTSGDAQAETPVEASAETPAETPANDYYAELKVTDIADFGSIHLAFWRMLRVLLRQEVGLVGPNRLPHLRRIQRLWIAHDILCDPVTRADYDFRRMGLRGDDEAERAAQGTRGPRTQLRIGELLQCAGLLEQTELDIAADMHKAMPEMMFGTFLVKQGFIEEADLDCVLVGQQLLKTGDITVVQFQTVMIERSATGLDIGEMLLAKGYVNEFMLERAYRNQSEDTLVKVPIVVAPGQVTKIELKPHHEEVSVPEPVVEEAAAAEESPAQEEWTPPVEASTEPLHAMLEAPQIETKDAGSEQAAEEPSLVERVEAARATLSDTNFVSERSLKLSNAAPAWKDQLDWSSPDSSEQPSQEETQPVDEAAGNSFAPNTVTPLNPDTLADSVRAIAQIWASEPDPVSAWSRSSVPEPASEPAPELTPEPAPEVAPEPAPQPAPEPEAEVAHQPTPQVEFEPAAEVQDEPFVEVQHEPVVDARRQLSPELARWARPDDDRLVTTGPLSTVEDDSGESLTTGDNPFLSHDSLTPSTLSEEAAEAIASAVPDEAVPASAVDDIVSEIETSSQLPSLSQLEAQARNKEKHRQEPKRGTGDWQIMSVPGSALTSLFLDDEPERPHEGNAFITESADDQYSTGPQRIVSQPASAQGAAAAGASQSSPPDTIPPGDSALQNQNTLSNTSGNQTGNSAGNQAANPANNSNDNPPDNESRKARRRRTRS